MSNTKEEIKELSKEDLENISGASDEQQSKYKIGDTLVFKGMPNVTIKIQDVIFGTTGKYILLRCIC